jgi:hypothetical protein
MLTFISNSGKFFILSLEGTLYISMNILLQKEDGCFTYSLRVGEASLALLICTRSLPPTLRD